MRSTTRPLLRLVLLVSLLTALGLPIPAGATDAASVQDTLESLRGLPIDDLFEGSFRALLLRDPETITWLGLAEFLGVRNNRLTDISITYEQETMALKAGILEILRAYDRDGLSQPTKTYYDVYAWYLDILYGGTPTASTTTR